MSEFFDTQDLTEEQKLETEVYDIFYRDITTALGRVKILNEKIKIDPNALIYIFLVEACKGIIAKHGVSERGKEEIQHLFNDAWKSVAGANLNKD